MVFGMGLGIVLVVAVVFITYIIQRQIYLRQIEDLQIAAQISAEDLEAWARGLGMVFPDEVKIVAPVSQNENNDAQLMEEAHIEDLEALARELGMVIPDEIVTSQPMGQAEPVLPPQVPAVGHVSVHIPANIISTQIAEILHVAGVVADFDEFTNFLTVNRFDRSLMAGDFLLPLNGDFNVILEQILAGNRP